MDRHYSKQFEIATLVYKILEIIYPPRSFTEVAIFPYKLRDDFLTYVKVAAITWHRRNPTSRHNGESAMFSQGWHRRHAIQIAAALPEAIEDQLLVLDLARELVLGFLSGPAPQSPDLTLERERGKVVSLSSAINGNNR
jgi:hypothetical protein